jgi:hypothetical protein
MDKRTPIQQDPLDRIIADAVRDDMARVYKERRETPRELVQSVARPSIFLRRQAA